MTFEEAKKILEEEGFYVEKATGPCVLNGSFTKYESPEICEAVQVVCSAGYKVLMFETAFQARKERLKKEYEKNTKAPGPGEEQPKENSLKAATDAFILQANEIMRLKKKNAELLEAIDKMKEGNPALKESASQFNDALLDEQAKKIKELTKEKVNLEDQITILDACKKHNDKTYRKQIKCLGKEIARLNGIIHKKNLKIEELRKESSRHLRGKIKMFGENMDLEQMLKDKNAVLSDVAEELRLTKIREKNLTEVGQKYMKEVEDLRQKLVNKVVDKIDAQALKSAESALAWKEKVIAEKDMALAYYEKKLKEKTKLVEIVRNASKEYCDYGVAANEFIKELAHLYVLADNNGIINLDMLERCKNYQTYGFPANCNRETKKEIDDIAKGDKNKKPRIPTPEESKYDSIIERCKRLGIELHYHDGKVPTYTNAFGDEVPVYGLRGIFAICTDEEYKSLFKK